MCDPTQPWNGPCEKPLDTFDLCYDLLALGAPDKGTTFKDWPNISAISSGQYSLVSCSKAFESKAYSASTDRRGLCGLKTGCPVQRVMAGQNVGIGTGPYSLIKAL